MELKQIHRILILTFVLCFKIIRGDNSEAKKWHIIGDVLFYIEVEQKYTANDTFQSCESLGMLIDVIYFEPIEISTYLEKFYGYVPSLWFGNCQNDGMGYLLRSQKSETEIVIKPCSEKFGFICSAEIVNGEIKYKNGTQLFIKTRDVMKYCNPQGGHTYDQQNCMIVFERLMSA